MSALDQVIGFPLQIFEREENEVDEIVERSLVEGTPDAAIEYGWNLVAGGHLSGLKLCKLLYELTELWDKFSTDDDIQDAVFKGMGVPGETYRKYEGIWRHIFANENIPTHIRQAMRNKPLGGLIAISVAARDGEFNEDNWNKLASAHDKAAMLDIRDEVRGVDPSETRRRYISWNRDGRLVARRGDEGPEEVGYFPKRTGIDFVDETVQWMAEQIGAQER